MRKLEIAADTKSHILRLREDGVPFRKIAAEVHVSLGSVMRFANATAPATAKRARRKHAVPDLAGVGRKMARGISKKEIWRDYVQRTPGAYGYDAFAAFIKSGPLQSGGPATPLELRPSAAEHCERCGYWAEIAETEMHRAGVAVTVNYGATLKVRCGSLIIYEEGRERSIMPGTHGLRAVIVQGSASITTDAVAWLQRAGVALIMLRDYELVSVVADLSFAGVELRTAQYQALNEPLRVARAIIAQKIESGQRAGVFGREKADRFILDTMRAKSVPDLFMIEAQAAREYFTTLQFALRHTPKLWPDAWTHWTARHSRLTASPRKATHPINAILNLGYSVVAGQLARALAVAGFDVAAGFLHSPKEGRASLAYDAIELLRAGIDDRLLAFAKSRVWRREDFPVTKEGVVRLSPALAKIVTARALALESEITTAVAFMCKTISADRPA